MFLFLAFAAILTVTFGTVALVGSSSRSQRMIEKRVTAVLSWEHDATLNRPQIQSLLKSEPDGIFAGLDSALEKQRVWQAIAGLIVRADMKVSPVAILLSCLGLAAAGFGLVYIWVSAVPVQVGVAAAFAYGPIFYLKFKGSRRIKLFDTNLPDGIDMMSRALRAGHSMAASINVIAEQGQEPVRSEFSEVFKQQNFGLPLRDALEQMLERVPSQDLRVMVTGILVQKETGGNLAEILDRTSQTIRERLKIQGEIRTHTAQGRMTGWILCALPVVMLIVINFLNPGYSKVLIDTPTGRMLSYVGVALLVIGGFIIRQIVNGIEV